MKRIFFIISLLAFSASWVSAQDKKQYNVLMIAVDDLNDWTGFLGGHPQTQTPNMDRLAQNGQVFTQAYCAASVCNPSRTALMSGYRPSTTGALGNGYKLRSSPLLKDAPMLNQWFQQNGYYTLSRGKIFHHPDTDNDKWDEWSNNDGRYGKPAKKKEGKEYSGLPTSEYDGNLNWGGTTAAKEDTPDYRTAQWAAEQLQKERDKPFFMAVGIFRPHLSWFVPQQYFDKFPTATLQMPEVKADDLDDIPGEKPSKEYRLVKKHGLEKEAVQAYLASINYADECIGVILDALDKSPYRDNTIVVLWGDHGWHLGEKLRYKKFTLWERAARMPLIVSAPGVTKSGARSEQIVSLLDLYPTLTELCGLPENTTNEGTSFLPLLKNPNKKWNVPAVTTLKEGHSLRVEHWRYIRRHDGVEELYDHQQDPKEYTNLAMDKKYEDKLKDLRKLMDKTITPKDKALTGKSK
ncbi:sulfatase [Limibacter armeniacum]|uniref:sulfatase n=1 Tax=Limibacter armeniacum TaxID=466084 RepID=UPI002FE55215